MKIIYLVNLAVELDEDEYDDGIEEGVITWKWRWYEELREQRTRDMKLRCFNAKLKEGSCVT